MEAEGLYVLQSGGRCRYARVRVRYLAEASGPNDRRVELAAGLAQNSGWSAFALDAAVTGATEGLESAGVVGRCVVTWLHDPNSVPPNVTTPQAIRIAAARAVWAAVGFTPDETAGSEDPGGTPRN